MPLWSVTVVELRAVEVDYTVEADTKTEASDKAGRGETVTESPSVREIGVRDREIVSGPDEVADDGFTAMNPDPDWLRNPCPICGRVQSCEHTLAERGGR